MTTTLPLPLPLPQTQSGPPPSPTPKRRAACDECRTRKLRCSGEQPSCSRCGKEGLSCVYSAQKRMGRPKKRLKIEDDDDDDGRAAREVRVGDGRTGGSRKRVRRAVGEQAWDGTGSGSGTGMALGLGNESRDAAGVEEYLTPGGSLQPWLQGTEWSVPGETNIPDLTPDSSSESPLTINLPPELSQSSTDTQSHNYHQSHTDPPPMLLDPSLASPGLHLGHPSTALPTCACLSTLYLTLNTLQALDPTASTFPSALHPLREAMRTASEVLSCDQCPTKFLSAIQNTQLVGTLLMSIAERFSKVLESITAEAERAELQGEEKSFRLADLNTPTGHFHPTGLGCAAAFNISLLPREWRSMTKKLVRVEVYGPTSTSSSTSTSTTHNPSCAFSDEDPCSRPSMLGIIAQMESRQGGWHCRKSEDLPSDFPKHPDTGLPMGGGNIPKGDHTCLKLCAYARKLVEGFDWS